MRLPTEQNAGWQCRLSSPDKHPIRQSDPIKGEHYMASDENKKCAHLVCSCNVTSGKYCSTECEAMEKTPDIACKCPHAGCKGHTVSQAASR